MKKQTPEVKSFLVVLRGKIKSTDPQVLQERANAAVAKLSADAKGFEKVSQNVRQGLLHYAISENNPYFVRALLQAGINKKYLAENNASNPLAFLSYKLDADTLEIIKCLKEYGSYVIDLGIDNGGRLLFNYLPDKGLKDSPVKVEIACEVLPSTLGVNEVATIAKFEASVVIELYEKNQDKFDPAFLKQIYMLVALGGKFVSYELSKHEIFKDLDFSSKDLHLILISLSKFGYYFCDPAFQNTFLNFLTKFLDMKDVDLISLTIQLVVKNFIKAFHTQLFYTFPLEMIKDPNFFNTETPKIWHPIPQERIREYQQYLNSNVKENEANEQCKLLISFLLATLDLIEQKTQKTLQENNIHLEEFLFERNQQIQLKREKMEASIVLKDNWLHSQFLIYQARAKWAMEFISLHLLCDLKRYEDFFLKELYLFSPEILAELMHIANPEFNLFLYDKVNQIAKTSEIQPPILMAALRAQKIQILRHTKVDEFLSDLTPAITEKCPKPYLQAGTDVTKHILNLTLTSRTFLSFALLTPKNSRKFLLNDEFGRSQWLSYRDKLRSDINILPLFEIMHRYQKINDYVAKKILDSGNTVLFTKLRGFTNNTITINEDELAKELIPYGNQDVVKKILSLPKFEINLRLKIRNLLYQLGEVERWYINSYISEKLSEPAHEAIRASKVEGTNALGFLSIFQRKKAIMKIIAENRNTEILDEPASKKQKFN